MDNDFFMFLEKLIQLGNDNFPMTETPMEINNATAKLEMGKLDNISSTEQMSLPSGWLAPSQKYANVNVYDFMGGYNQTPAPTPTNAQLLVKMEEIQEQISRLVKSITFAIDIMNTLIITAQYKNCNIQNNEELPTDVQW